MNMSLFGVKFDQVKYKLKKRHYHDKSQQKTKTEK